MTESARFCFPSQQGSGYALSGVAQAVTGHGRRLLISQQQQQRQLVCDHPSADPPDGCQLRPGHLQLPVRH